MENYSRPISQVFLSYWERGLSEGLKMAKGLNSNGVIDTEL